jgi:hypothetical protein
MSSYTDVNVAYIRFNSGGQFRHFYVDVETRARFAETGELSSIVSYCGLDLRFSGQSDSDNPHWYALRVEFDAKSDYMTRAENNFKAMKKWNTETANVSDIAVMFHILCKICKVKTAIVCGFNDGKEMSIPEAMAIFARETSKMLGEK